MNQINTVTIGLDDYLELLGKIKNLELNLKDFKRDLKDVYGLEAVDSLAKNADNCRRNRIEGYGFMRGGK